MTRTLAAALAIAGTLLTIGGAILGLLPIHTSGVDCGSAFVASEYGGNTFLGASVCDGPRSSARLPAIALLAVGGCQVVIAGILVAVAADERRQDAVNGG